MEKQTSKQATPNKQVSGGFSSHANTQNAAREEDDLATGLTSDEEADQEVEDADPVLDENDLEENDLSDEEADNIDWDEENSANQ
ncbi:hypothetical protein [Chitinophaga sp.]|uniref:hypothetical protein n=1 Tax=Chitinophaga sp. TaxID=1869181 RepID=UPI002CE19B97|nr:hypothetical protein [Chitinophaga sp.]HWV66678.1 hypothetical protein [Chitinophaga sp.]